MFLSVYAYYFFFLLYKNNFNLVDWCVCLCIYIVRWEFYIKKTKEAKYFLLMTEVKCVCVSVCVLRYKRSSLKILGTVGEPINPEAWQWYYNVVGEKRCPIVDTFWQTETVSSYFFSFHD